METACEYDDRNVMRVSTDERRMINRMMKLAEQYPDEVEIIERPETNDGCLYLKCPADWLLIRHPKKMNYTDEQRAAMADRLNKIRNTKNDDEEDDE